MSKLFVSYPSESWNFAQRLAENLAKYIEDVIFIDYRSVDNPDFEVSIVGHLKASDAVLLVVTEYTFEDIEREGDWVRREIRTALENDIPIVLVRENGMLPPNDLPDDVRNVSRSQGFPFYREFFDPGIVLLKDFLITIGVSTPRSSTDAPQPILSASDSLPPPSTPAPQRDISGKPSFDEALDLLEAGDFNKALFILEALRDKNLRSHLAAAIEEMIARARLEITSLERRREAALDYEDIATLAERKLTESTARTAFEIWCKQYPDLIGELDLRGLRARLTPFKAGPKQAAPTPDLSTNPSSRKTESKKNDPQVVPPPALRKGGAESPSKPRSLLKTLETIAESKQFKVLDVIPSPFAWIDIPGALGKNWKDIPYAIAKYPVTNDQYAKFVVAGGYAISRWWTASGWTQRLKEDWKQPRYGLGEANHPVIGVSWFEAIAFCAWLSETSGEMITLPTEDQWHYAAQGDDGRIFPWGNTWDCNKCNNSVRPCDSDADTSVQRYEGTGDSFFGVTDLVGNTWEWCLTDYDQRTNEMNSSARRRALRGGAWDYTSANFFHITNRGQAEPGLRINLIGFRLVRL